MFNKEASNSETLNGILADITCYKGSKSAPRWTDIDTGMHLLATAPTGALIANIYRQEFFSTLCTVYADTSKVARQKIFGTDGYYYRQNFKVVLSCGLTEMKAQISWMENVRPVTSAPAVHMY